MIKAGSAFIIALLASTCHAQAVSIQDSAALAAPASSAATIYIAREFRTMDPAVPVAEAVAVRDGRFVAVGSLAEVQRAVPEARIDKSLADKIVTAGFVEPHVHPVLAALTMAAHVLSIEDWDTTDGFSPAIRDERTYRAKLQAALKAHKGPAPFLSWGYHHYFHGELTRAMLDKWAPDFPVVVWHRSGHEVFMNTLAMKKVGVDEAFVAALPEAARKQANLAKGHLYEAAFIGSVGKLAPIMASPEALKRGLEYSVRYYHQNGITFACEPGGIVSKPLQNMVNDVLSPDSVPFNHCFIADGKTFAGAKIDDPAAVLADTKAVENWGRGRTFYLPGQVKLFTDGAIFSQLMQMKDGYTDGHHGEWIMAPDAFQKAFRIYWDAGYYIHVHNNGDAGADQIVSALSDAQARMPRSDHRTDWIHFGFAQPDQVKRWAALGGIVSSNPYYVTALAGRYAKLGVGPERSANMVPHGYVMANGGMTLSFHSDMPMAPAKPLQLVWSGVTRITAEGPVAGPEHRVDIDTAMQAITINAARSIRLENRIGSITPGKDANLTVLESSPWQTAPEKLRDIKVWGTMLEGRMQPVQPQAAMVKEATPVAATEQERQVLTLAAGEQIARVMSGHLGED